MDKIGTYQPNVPVSGPKSKPFTSSASEMKQARLPTKPSSDKTSAKAPNRTFYSFPILASVPLART